MKFQRNHHIIEFEKIVSRYKDRLFRFAFMRVGVRETAEDMVQEVFIRLYKALLEGTAISNEEYYLLHSINNACIDFFRKKRPLMTSLQEVNDLPDDADTDIMEEFVRIRNLLGDLPPEQAETVRLKCYDGLTFRQIAELQDVTESAAKARYRYAISKIRQKLTGES